VNFITGPVVYGLGAALLASLAFGGVQWAGKQSARVTAANAQRDQQKAEKALEVREGEIASERARFEIEAREQEHRHAADMARIQREAAERAKEAGDAAYNRAVADVRAGRLRNVWTCPAAAAVSAPSGTTTGGDGRADDRAAAVGRILRIGAEADQRLRDCQAVIMADRQ
jgi:hypothetical protein